MYNAFWGGKMPPRTLLIFIDGLPYDSLTDSIFLRQMAQRARVVPGMGYSVNIHAELYAGYQPDQVGFFGEWNLKPNNAYPGIQMWLPLWRLCDKPISLSRIVHKLLSFRYGYIGLIPFDMLPLFQRTAIHIPSQSCTFPHLQNQCPFQLVLPESNMSSQRVGERDAVVYDQALQAIQQRRDAHIFVSFEDLDGVAHHHGVGSPAYREQLRNLDNGIQGLTSAFIAHEPDGRVVVLSDHGMVNVQTGVDLQTRTVLGEPGEHTYAYFMDSTLLRVWIFDLDLSDRVQRFLSSEASGRILTASDRHRFGITNRDFGDFIYLLQEGFVFAPSFFGIHAPKAMHGYHPDLQSQHGVLFTYETYPDSALPSQLNSIEVYRYLKGLLGLD